MDLSYHSTPTHYAMAIHVLFLFAGTFFSIISPFSTFQSLTLPTSPTKSNSKQKQLLQPSMTELQYFIHTSTLMLVAIYMQFIFYMLLEYSILCKLLFNHILFILYPQCLVLANNQQMFLQERTDLYARDKY